MRIKLTDCEPDETTYTVQPQMFGPEAECILKQRPLFDGGMEKSRRAERPREDQKNLFALEQNQ